MRNPKALLFIAVVLAMVSIARADLTLTVNGLDTTSKPLEIKGTDNLVIAIAGQSDIRAQDISVTCDNGKLEPLTKPDKYLFTFLDESNVDTVSLNVGEDVVYQLTLFYIPETDTVIVFGVDKEALIPLELESEAQPELEPELKLESEPEPELVTELEPEPELEQRISEQETYSFRTFSISDCNDILDPNWFPNLNNDQFVNFKDFAILAENWLKSGAALDGDFDRNEMVDFNDLAYLCYYWLANTCGLSPEEVFESFKVALVAGNIDEAVSYFAYFVAEDYRVIFNENIDELQNMVNNMGNLTLEYIDRDIAVYEISNAAGTKFYPVVFTQADNGQWKIAIF